ncbi:testicular haploid expressed gene protein [Cyclopterus lumpus]|uniref:testicular haploid expressed gene protein n=1 Tax=Cyclopterus lumpus TaxID=8103 RepID=UPI00148602EB|nr:testicular haploid expressed gene protein [Cyclopterus lumpus]
MFSRKTPRPSSEASRYERIVRLSTPRTRSCSSQEAGQNRPVWHVDPRAKAAVVTARLLRLANPKPDHPDFLSNRESVASVVSFASKTARISKRLVRLSLPRLKRSNDDHELGRPVEPIWTVSKAALRATASARVETLATPKRLSEDYVPPREPDWNRTNVHPHPTRTRLEPDQRPPPPHENQSGAGPTSPHPTRTKVEPD